MKKEVNPRDTDRKEAFELWMKSPMPMVTLTKTFDVSHIYKISKRKTLKFNMLWCWCIGKAASGIKEFYLLPEQGKLYKYDRLAVNVIVMNKVGGLSSCDIPYIDDLEQFNADYQALTQSAFVSCENTFVKDAMVIGTSAMPTTELDCVVNQYTDLFCNPMVMWGKYRKEWFKVLLPISFQFHHTQMDGSQATWFLKELQNTINTI